MIKFILILPVILQYYDFECKGYHLKNSVILLSLFQYYIYLSDK